MSSYVACKTNVSGRQHAFECNVCWQCIGLTFFCAGSDGYTFLVLVRGRKFQGTKVGLPGSESSTYGSFGLGSESTWERKFHNSKRSRLCYSVASVCRLCVTLCIVAKQCVQRAKLLLTAYRKSQMRKRLVLK